MNSTACAVAASAMPMGGPTTVSAAPESIGMEWTTGNWTTGANNYLGEFLAAEGLVGLQFGSGFSIPKDAVISSATLTIRTSTAGGSGPGACTVYGWDVDDGTFSTSSPNYPSTIIAAPAVTAATVANSSWPTGQDVVLTVTGIVQEIVNRAGYAAGQNICFVLRDDSTVDGDYISINGNEALTTLEVTYTDPPS